MRILTYKRTHTGDPNEDGVFGINDCMGQVRDLEYEAVIGIGGIGSEARKHRIDGKITWVGIAPSKHVGDWASPLVTFKHFLLFDAGGPTLASLAPNLARRMYEGKVRYLLTGYTLEEQADAQAVVNWVITATQGVQGKKAKMHKGYKIRCISQSSKCAENKNITEKKLPGMKRCE
ncbi:hypothetical protein WNB94_17150 [Aquabacterium sp. A3]|uniref:hypothetical protein n=1 Tax=Aquabacterium sp. A3 TaxID=3132829 RepID=UPI00311926CF